MELIKSINEIKEKISSSSLTIGTFDGMHRGHSYLIDETLKKSNKDSNPSVVVTFSPNPFVVLNDINQQEYHLINNKDKHDILDSLGINFLLELDFNERMAGISAEYFLKYFIVNPFNPKNIIIGHDHHFGKNRRGNNVFLKENETRYQYTLSVVEPFSLQGETVSSSAIRKFVKSGDIITANKYLGRNYKIKGRVVEGNGVGRELEFPTANIEVDTINQIIPQKGVYFVKTKINREKYYGMCNIGYRPTISSENIFSIEVHIFNYFRFDLYAQLIEIEFVDYVRSEKKFKNKEELKLQLIKDKEYCKSLQILKGEVNDNK